MAKVESVSIIHNCPDNMRISCDETGTHRTLGRAIGILLVDTDISSHFSSSQTLLFREASSDHLSHHFQSHLPLSEALVTI